MTKLTTARSDARRDKIFVPVINWLMGVLLTRDYRMFVQGAIEYGMRTAARDRDMGLPAPPRTSSTSGRHPDEHRRTTTPADRWSNNA